MLGIAVSLAVVTELGEFSSVGVQFEEEAASVFGNGTPSFLTLVKHAPSLAREGAQLFHTLALLRKTDLGALAAEAKDYDDAEKAQLAAAFSLHFDLPNDSIEATIEAGFGMMLAVVPVLLSFFKFGAPTA